MHLLIEPPESHCQAMESCYLLLQPFWKINKKSLQKFTLFPTVFFCERNKQFAKWRTILHHFMFRKLIYKGKLRIVLVHMYEYVCRVEKSSVEKSLLVGPELQCKTTVLTPPHPHPLPTPTKWFPSWSNLFNNQLEIGSIFPPQSGYTVLICC